MQLVLFNPLIGPYQVLPFRARLDQGAMAMKWCSAFPKASASLEPHHQIVYCYIQDTHWGGVLPPLQRCSLCILQPQLTGQGGARSLLFAENTPRPVLDFSPENGSAKETMADLGPFIRHLVSTRLPSGGRAAPLSPLSPMYGTRLSV